MDDDRRVVLERGQGRRRRGRPSPGRRGPAACRRRRGPCEPPSARRTPSRVSRSTAALRALALRESRRPATGALNACSCNTSRDDRRRRSWRTAGNGRSSKRMHHFPLLNSLLCVRNLCSGCCPRVVSACAARLREMNTLRCALPFSACKTSILNASCARAHLCARWPRRRLIDLTGRSPLRAHLQIGLAKAKGDSSAHAIAVTRPWRTRNNSRAICRPAPLAGRAAADVAAANLGSSSSASTSRRRRRAC